MAMDDGEFVARMNEMAARVAHAIEAGMIHPANLDRLRQAMDRHTLAEAERLPHELLQS